MPKPLLPIAGVPLIGRLLGAVQPLMPEAIVCIINNQGTSVADYVRQHYPALPIQFVQQDTASSYESFTVLCAHLRGSPFLVTTVDSVFPPDFLPQFVAAASQQPGMDMMLTLTTFIDDEKPLHVRLDAHQRIVQLGDAARGSAYVTSGFYYCSPTYQCGLRCARADTCQCLTGVLRLAVAARLLVAGLSGAEDD